MSKNGIYCWAGERDVPGAASFWPWNRTVEGPKSAVSGAMDGGANVAEFFLIMIRNGRTGGFFVI
ncbi:MAG: hypothetical protein B1H13_13995 [Desulfobacteraceae bacterium 4484_190.3]|nr:MAG: hypothetical protein B1H13_13995 [Desulfobacteraceae bacterium 4484_190.3]